MAFDLPTYTPTEVFLWWIGIPLAVRKTVEKESELDNAISKLLPW